ncbi:zinc finger protein 423 homolog [Nilaparvata lugens]|uniref:zinc finger protein 423 homolog n=1 Tax=Nilaparvata lugens TaxID=108931 RepID=UPI00193C957A|nr:zinc finger protein 423 homolog [Nilaparvata lugens]
MSRRKQAKPRSLKRDEDDWPEGKPETVIGEGEEVENKDQEDDDDEAEDADEEDAIAQGTPHFSTAEDHACDGLHDDQENSLGSEALGSSGTEGSSGGGGDSWVSGEEGGSSCATPNSGAGDSPPSDLAFTVGVTEGTPYACQFCDKAFPRLSYLKKHEQTHSDQMPFRCEFCSRLFKHKRSRDRHIKLHTGDKKYRCTQCEAAFSRSDHLKIHMKTHDNQKPFQCTVCNRGYNTAAALTSHMQNHKKASSVSPSSSPHPTNTFKCLQCAELFRKPEELQAHMASHHQVERSPTPSSTPPGMQRPSNVPSRLPFPLPRLACMYCTKDNFSTMEALHLHVQAMHGSILNGDLSRVSTPTSQTSQELNSPSPLTVACDLCTMRFGSLSALHKHALATHGYRPSKDHQQPLYCVQCAMTFPTPALFAEHYVLLHGLALAEQLKPTDLSLAKRPTLDEHAHSRKRARHAENGHGNRHQPMETNNPMFNFQKPNFLIQVHFAVKHSNETKVLRCTGCQGGQGSQFHSEQEFAAHIRTCHLPPPPPQLPPPPPTAAFLQQHLIASDQKSSLLSQLVRCLFCRLSFSSELELQLHLAVHTKQLHCPLCPQTFHVEFLLDRHMQTHHTVQTAMNGEDHDQKPLPTTPNKTTSGGSSSNRNCNSANSDGSGAKNGNNAIIPNGNTNNNNSNINNNNNNNLSSNNNSSSCELCDRSDFSSEAELAAHRKLIHHVKTQTASAPSSSSSGKVSLHCAYCSENCKSRAELENHMKTHSQGPATSGKHKCNICDEICPSASTLAEHKLTHCKVINGSSCTQCKASLSNEDQYLDHLRQHSCPSPTPSPTLSLPTPCVVCRQTLVSEMEARIHARFHLQQVEAQAQCCSCLQGFERRELVGGLCRDCYNKHGKSASPTRCPECQLKFETGPALEAHLASVHSKAYQCVKCQLSFDSEREIQLHVASHLLSEGALPGVGQPAPGTLPGAGSGEECRLCLRVLPSRLQLQTHLIEHTFAGCSTFTCYLCSAVFTAAHGLQSHMMEHGPDARPYDCPRCPLKFFFRAELDNHSYTHLDESDKEQRVATPSHHRQQNKSPTGIAAESLQREVKQEIKEESGRDEEDRGEDEDDEEEQIDVEEGEADSLHKPRCSD